MAKEARRPIEVNRILENMEMEVLELLAEGSDSTFFETVQELARRYGIQKRNEILDLQTEDERKFANEASSRKGMIYGISVLIEIVRGAKKELDKRLEKEK